MIIKKDYLNRSENYLQKEKDGLNKAIENFDKRYKNNEVERTNFFKGLDEYSKRQINLNKRIENEMKK